MPTVKETKEDVAEGEVELGSYVATEFRGLAARANYLSLGRPDIQFMQGNGQADGKRHAEDEKVGQVSFSFPPYYF